MHLITITRPSSGRWESGLWVVLGPHTDDLVLDQLPVYVSGPGDYACANEECAALNLSRTLVKWREEADGSFPNHGL